MGGGVHEIATKILTYMLTLLWLLYVSNSMPMYYYSYYL